MPVKIVLADGRTYYLQTYQEINSFTNISELDIEFNEEYSIGVLPPNLIKLKCNNNYLRKLPELPDSLRELDCSNNFISEIPNIKNVKKLICFNNKFETNYFEKYDNIEIISQ